MEKYRLMVAIPAFNESKSIKNILRKIPKRISSVKLVKILVIDDGSLDSTSEKARMKGVKIIRHLINRGLGASLKTAFVVANNSFIDILVTLDADGQHNPKDIKRLIQPIVNKRADVVVGSRLIKNSNMPLDRKLVNYLANIATFLLTGIWSTDSQSGLRAFNRKAIQKINLITQRMEVSSEIFREIKKHNLKTKEIAIKPVYTDYSLKKGQSVSNAPNVFLKLLIRIFRR